MNNFFKFWIYLILIIIISSMLGNYFFLFDLFAHFYLQLFLSASILLIYNIIHRNKLESLISVVLSLFLFLNISSADFSGIFRESQIRNPELYYMNALFKNTETEVISKYIDEVNPKQIAVVELNENLYEKIRNKNRFKYSYYYPDEVYSFGFFTNEEILEQKTFFSENYPIGYFKTSERSYYIIHPLPPFDRTAYISQKIFFAYLRSLLDNEKSKFILVGDFNSTFYSSVFQSTFSDFFYKPTYSRSVNSLLTIPIDYAISREKLKIYPGRKLSSDHIPLLINF